MYNHLAVLPMRSLSYFNTVSNVWRRLWQLLEFVSQVSEILNLTAEVKVIYAAEP